MVAAEVAKVQGYFLSSLYGSDLVLNAPKTLQFWTREKRQPDIRSLQRVEWTVSVLKNTESFQTLYVFKFSFSDKASLCYASVVW